MWKNFGLEIRQRMTRRGRDLAPLIVNCRSIDIVNDYTTIIGVGTRAYEDRGLPPPDNDNDELWDDDYDPFYDPRFDGFPAA